jgi:hypothetical protein
MTADLSTTQILLAMFGQASIQLAAFGVVIKILAKRQDRPAVIAPAILPTNGVKEVTDLKLKRVEDLMDQKFDEHERRITKHQAEFREEIDVINRRLETLSKK